MKLNIDKTGNTYRCTILGEVYDYGWYKSGKAFIAKDGVLLSLAEARRLFVPYSCFNSRREFVAGGRKYKNNMDGFVRSLIHRYNR